MKDFRVLLIDDHRLVSEGISSLLTNGDLPQETGRQVVVDAAHSAQEGSSLLAGDKEYHLILLDLAMPSIGGFDFLSTLRSHHQKEQVIVLSASDDDNDMQKAWQLGARGYICKFEHSSEMLRRIIRVVRGEHGFPERFEVRQVEASEGMSSLSRRQQQVLGLIVDGKSNQQIADILAIAEPTVKFHVREVFKELGVHTRAMCVKEAINRGLISAGDA